MKKFKFKIKTVDFDDIDDRTLLLNLYGTQLFTLFIGFIIMYFQGQSISSVLSFPSSLDYLIWGSGFAAIVLIVDLLISRFVPDEVTDDGGVNDRIFRHRAIWHIALLSAVVAVCEEVLFRGAVQHWAGPYWTSIIFATIHVRYLKHWLMTGLVFSISYGLGWIYIQTGTIWTPIMAHFLIDFVMGLIIRFRKDEFNGREG